MFHSKNTQQKHGCHKGNEIPAVQTQKKNEDQHNTQNQFQKICFKLHIRSNYGFSLSIMLKFGI